MNRLSKTFFLGSYLGGTIALWILGTVIWGLSWTYNFPEESLWMFIALFIFLVPLSIYVSVVQCIFIYKVWASIQDGHVRSGPCKALGFLFIPLFNFYWIFQAVWGFAVDFNKYAARNNISAAPRLPEGLFLAYCILYVVGIIPFVGIAANIANFVIAAILISHTCDAVNALPSPNVKSS
jgi:hypothetical protein